MRSIQIFLSVILSTLTLASFANQSPGVTVFPQVGVTTYSGASDIEVDPDYGLGVGYQFTSPWAIELTYLKGSSSLNDATGTDVDTYLWHLNGLYHVYNSKKVRPYVTFGLGESNVSISGESIGTEKQVNAGVGIKWQGWENTDFRTEFKVYESEADNVIRSTFNVGIHHVITNASTSSKKRSGQLASFGGSNTDNDRDGVANGRDQCPNSPSGQTVNKVGCPTDKDQDGVVDSQDKCPNTTNRRNVIDTNGCYVTLRRPVQLNVLFHFDFDSYATKPEHASEVKKIVSFARKHSDTSIELSGHTDSVGSETYNQALSKARVAAVAKLVEMNTRIPKSKISKQSFGESKPKRENDNFANRRANRRVEGTVKAVTETHKLK